ncbi:MAG TPA: AAA family ATPase, partial [Anaerolineae bacterium]|nr:AAA family ATPase [Anaerolineae bacterium]
MSQLAEKSTIRNPKSNGTPPWVQELLDKYSSGVAHAFILHFNVFDYVVPGVSLKSYLARLMAGRQIVAFYNRSEGITFALPAMRERFVELLGLGEPQDAALAALQSIQGAMPEDLPRSPGAALPLLERLLKLGDPEEKLAAVVVDFAESILPAADIATMSAEDRTNLITVQRWGRDPDIVSSGNPVFLVTENLADLHSSIRAASSKFEAIEIPLPDREARLAFIEYYAGTKPQAFEWELSREELANATAGLSLIHIEDIFLRAEQEGKLTWELVRERKEDIIASEFGEVLEIMEPRFGWEMIGGLQYVKDFFNRSVIRPMREGRTHRVPMGVLMLGPSGTGKCITGESMVVTNKGLVPIADIPRYWYVHPETGEVAGLEVLSVTPDAAVKMQPASHWLDMGEGETVRVTVKRGMTIEGTPEHPILVVNGSGRLEWRPLGDVCEGDIVAIKFDHQQFGYDHTLEPETAYVFGLLTGDGNLTFTNGIRFSTADRELLDTITSYMQDRYGLDAHTSRRGGAWHTRWYGWEAKQDLLDKGLQMCLSRQKVVPSTVLQGMREVQIAFLRGLFDTDGGFHRYTFQYTSASHQLARQVVEILLNLGMVPSVREKIHPKGKGSSLAVELSGAELETFTQVVGFGLRRKQSDVNEYLARITDKARYNTTDLFYNLSQSLSEVRSEIGLVYSDAPGIYDHFYNGVKHGRLLRLTVEKLISWIETEGEAGPATKRMRSLLDAKLYFSPVTNVKRGYARVYDLHVPETHSFVANGFVNHNTAVAEAVAKESGINFVILNLARILGQWVGSSERNLEKALRAIESLQPTICFIDEIDQAVQRGTAGDSGVSNRIFKRLLEFMSDTGHRGRVLFLAASNRPDLLDAALKRPGRFDKKIPFLIPDETEREAIFQVMLRKYDLEADTIPARCITATEGWTGAEIEAAVVKALEVAEDEG